jgi:hypothetical protein
MILQGVLRWEAVEAAIKDGCHSVSGILAHITQQAAAARQQQREAAAQSGAASEHHHHHHHQQQQQQSELVRREHLARSLKAWCDEGRLFKPSRGWYDLPG